MKKSVLALAAGFAFASAAAMGAYETKQKKTGEELFKEHCAVCHPEGSNILNPGKTLRKAQREANGIMTKEDIVFKMRHPGKGMTTWSAATLPEEEAEAIADYIIATFK